VAGASQDLSEDI